MKMSKRKIDGRTYISWGMDGPKDRVVKRAQRIRSINPNTSVRVLKVSPGRYQIFVKP